MVRRSVLFSPGDQPELLEKAAQSDADVVVFDLEDAVLPSAKSKARDAVDEVLSSLGETDCEICIRINPLDAGGRTDVEALSTSPDSIMLPKVEGADEIGALTAILSEHELAVPILALLETAPGILHAEAIAMTEPTNAVLFGAEDLSADIGARRTAEGTEVLHARQQVVLAAAAADIDAIDTLVTEFENTDHLERDARRGREWGFDGKMAIHPAQVPVINETFSPDAEEIEWARKVQAAQEQADADSRGVFAVDGEMIDAPLLARAEQILERARQAGTEE